jgi:dipeptidase E
VSPRHNQSETCVTGVSAQPQIVTFGGGSFSMETGNPLVDAFALELTGRARPRVCFLPQASGLVGRSECPAFGEFLSLSERNSPSAGRFA